MTYKEAKMAGYVDADTAYQQGYVSRRCDPEAQEVQEAGGYRKGDLYVLLPNWNSTKYCIRQYLTKPED